MSMDQLMALVPIEAATALSTTTGPGRKSRWERSANASKGKKSRFGPKDVSQKEEWMSVNTFAAISFMLFFRVAFGIRLFPFLDSLFCFLFFSPG